MAIACVRSLHTSSLQSWDLLHCSGTYSTALAFPALLWDLQHCSGIYSTALVIMSSASKLLTKTGKHTSGNKVRRYKRNKLILDVHIIQLIVVCLFGMAFPDGCRHKTAFLPRLRP